MTIVFYIGNLNLFTTWYILPEEEPMQIFPFHMETGYYIYP